MKQWVEQNLISKNGLLKSKRMLLDWFIKNQYSVIIKVEKE
jgi:hypothetical protein